MKTLEEIQKENRELIVMANYKAMLDINNRNLDWRRNPKSYKIKKLNNYDEIISETPLTLSRVLIALAPSIENTRGVKINHYDLGLDKTLYLLEDIGEGCTAFFLDWELTKETLEEQSEETQRKVNKLIITGDNHLANFD